VRNANGTVGAIARLATRAEHALRCNTASSASVIERERHRARASPE
jgi:hypothetical protein